MKPAILAIWLLTGALALASDEPLVTRMDAYTVQPDDENGERLLPAESAEPGAVVEYRVALTNTGDTALAELLVNGPIPANTSYLAASAGGEGNSDLLVSVDGGKTYETEPVTRTIRDPNGETREIVVPPGQYTNLRWSVNGRLGPDETMTYRYRVRIDR